MREKAVKKNHSVEKVFQIIELMAREKGPMRLQDIATRCGLPASTTLRFLNTLMTFGYVSQDPDTLKYSLSLKFCHIGNMISSQLSIRDILRPFLLELSEKCQESSCLAREEDMTVVYIDVVDGPDNMLKTLQRIGKRAPLYCTGVGKLMLLNYDDTRLDLLLSKHPLARLTPNTITTRESLVAELQKIRSQGFSMDDEECELGARCIAAPIRDYTGNIIAAISVSGPISRMTKEKLKVISVYIRDIAARASEKFGYEGNGL